MPHDLLDTDISNLLGLDEMSDEEQIAFLDEIGSVVLEGALLRYVASLTEIEAEEFETFVSEHSDNDDLAALICEHYPDFEQCLTDEIAAFKADAMAVLKSSEEVDDEAEADTDEE